ncbi:porin [Azohydromonas lata]|uniref:porin n=1 Tax=Azohydromonas lata TaxID=45677 RepID=UPI0008305124|nr:porin [Azohydromonas lata]
MHKKSHLIAAAVLAGCATSALAQSSVAVFGIMDLYAESARLSGAPSVSKVSNGGLSPSRWGLRGSEALGGGLKAALILESGFAPDTGLSLQGGRLFGRQAWVSLASATAGEIRLGRQYAPMHYAMAGSDVEGFANFSPVLAMYLSGDQGRQDNQVSYWSPTLGGLSAAVAVAFGERATVAPGASAVWVPAAGTARNSVGGLLRYQSGALDASLAVHQGGQSLGSGTAKQQAFNLGAAWQFSSFLASGNYWEHCNDLPGTAATPRTRGAALGVRVPAGAWSFVAQAGWVQDNGRAWATGADKATGRNTFLNVGLNHALSKRTDVYVRWVRVTDDNGGFNGRATAALNGLFGPGNALAADGHAGTLAAGVRHMF